MTAHLRLINQQLVNPAFDRPEEVVGWMGAIQAQDYNMAKWAVGIRLKSATGKGVEKALADGKILRTHVLRPTWHFVAAEDIRWMLKLSGARIKSANRSFGKNLGISESVYSECNRLFEKMLQGNKNLTRQEIGLELEKGGITVDTSRIRHLLMNAETDGIVCSGADKGNTETYALLEERVPRTKELHKDEALAKLAEIYFRSHSPATLQDFAWWSGLPVTDARKGIDFIKSKSITEHSCDQTFFIYGSENSGKPRTNKVLHFLPAYDEYLISYKERDSVLKREHYPKAFNRYGIFYPVILYDGKITGNWSRISKKSGINIETSFFESDMDISEDMINEAGTRYKRFVSDTVSECRK